MNDVATTDRVNKLERENTHLRIMAASVRCPYGHRTVGGSCELGYPGCACMDDLMALTAWCPEDENKVAVRLGKRLAEAEAQFDTAAARLEQIAGDVTELATHLRYRLLAQTETEAA